jgi:hypothetical protein
MVRFDAPIGSVVEDLMLVIGAIADGELQGQVIFLPL